MKKKNSHEKEETVTDKKEFSWKRKDSHKWLQIKANACKQRLNAPVDRSTRQQYNKMRLSR